MTFRGLVRDGRIELEGGTSLPDGTIVRVEAVRPVRKKVQRSKETGIDPAFRLDRFAVKTGIPDLASEHDHYIYGTPKRTTRKTKARKRRS